jgi:hypothetical protein
MSNNAICFAIGFLVILAGCSTVPEQSVDTVAVIPDARYVLEGCHLSGKQVEQTLHSHIGARGLLNGGYIDALAFRLSDVAEADFTPPSETPHEHWFRGDQLPPVLDAAVRLVTHSHDMVPWFPTASELKSSDVHVYPMDLYCCCGSVEPTAARLVFVRKADRMVFYFGCHP